MRRAYDSERPREASRRVAVFAGGVILLTAVLATLLVWPQAFGAHRAPGLAQLVAFRAPLGIGLAALAVLAGVIAYLRRPGRRMLAAGLAIVLAAAAVTDAAVLMLRGWGGSHVVDGLPEGDLTVLSWNTQGGATSPEAVAQLALETRADIVALPETDAVAAAAIVRILDEHGHRMVPDTTGDSIPTSLLVSQDLGEYRLDEAAGSTPGLPSGVWTPKAGDAPPIVVAHPMPPLPGAMGEWQEGLAWIAMQCDALGPEVVVAGDLNATADHLWQSGDCLDAALGARATASGSWPSTAPGWLAAPIDHVLAGADWAAIAFRVIDTTGGSDHRPVVAVLDRR